MRLSNLNRRLKFFTNLHALKSMALKENSRFGYLACAFYAGVPYRKVEQKTLQDTKNWAKDGNVESNRAGLALGTARFLTKHINPAAVDYFTEVLAWMNVGQE